MTIRSRGWSRRRALQALGGALVAAATSTRPALARDASNPMATLWQAVATGNHVVLMRHATAPGVGDPAGFRLDRCATQRNLSAAGRREAAEIGDRFRANDAAAVRVLSSQWCRCLDTAVALGLSVVRPEPLLNSFFARGDRADAQTDALREWIRRRLPGNTLVLVTHQVNITALTGVIPRSGEMLVLRPDGGRLQLLGRLE